MKWDNLPHWKGDLINFKSSLLRYEHGGNGVGKKMSGFTKRPRQGCRAEDTAWLPQHPQKELASNMRMLLCRQMDGG